jgi:hypothetical protein
LDIARKNQAVTETTEQRLQRVRDEIVRILKENRTAIYRNDLDDAYYVTFPHEAGQQIKEVELYPDETT